MERSNESLCATTSDWFTLLKDDLLLSLQSSNKCFLGKIIRKTLCQPRRTKLLLITIESWLMQKRKTENKKFDVHSLNYHKYFSVEPIDNELGRLASALLQIRLLTLLVQLLPTRLHFEVEFYAARFVNFFKKLLRFRLEIAKSALNVQWLQGRSVRWEIYFQEINTNQVGFH